MTTFEITQLLIGGGLVIGVGKLLISVGKISEKFNMMNQKIDTISNDLKEIKEDINIIGCRLAVLEGRFIERDYKSVNESDGSIALRTLLKDEKKKYYRNKNTNKMRKK